MSEYMSIVNFVKAIRVAATALAVAVVGLLLAFGLAGCGSQSNATTEPAAQQTEAEFRFNNALLVEVSEELMEQDPVFKQALCQLTFDRLMADEGQEPSDDPQIFIGVDSEQVMDTVKGYLPVDNAYRNSAVALIFSSLTMEGRQDLVDALGPNDPVFQDDEILLLLPGIDLSGSGSQSSGSSRVGGSEALAA